MGKIAQFLGIEEGPATPDPALLTAEFKYEQLEEALTTMSLALEDKGWAKLTLQDGMDPNFDREALRQHAALARVMSVMNPLIKRGLSIRASYVHGQGVGITARAVGDDGEQDVNSVIQEFLDDDRNRAALTGHQAKLRLENSLGTDGNVFISLFTNPLVGKVQARTLPYDEISSKITVPGDKQVTMFYRRDWYENGAPHTAFYPDIRWRPYTRTKVWTDGDDSYPIMWDAPVYHLHDNGLDGWPFGIGDAYSSLPWARAYKEFLEDWVLLIKALSRIAFQMSKTKTPVSQQQRAALQAAPAGSTFTATGEQRIEAVPKSGATIDSESGRPVAVMVAAGLGVPVTTLLADPGQTGARAVAETLNQPTMLEFKGRQELWTEAFRAILGYVVDQAVIAPRGPLKGTIAREDQTLTVKLARNTDRTIEFNWPDINELPLETIMNAIVEADGTGKMPPKLVLQLMLRALGVRDVDEIIDEMTDEDGNWVDPEANAGDKAAQDFRRGDDKATEEAYS